MPRGVITDPPASPGVIQRVDGGERTKGKMYLFVKEKGYTFKKGDKVTFQPKKWSPGWGITVRIRK